MTEVDLQKLTFGLTRTWAGYLRDRDRSLRSGNYPATTRYNYLLAAAQLGRYLTDHSPDPDADAAGAEWRLLGTRGEHVPQPEPGNGDAYDSDHARNEPGLDEP